MILRKPKEIAKIEDEETKESIILKDKIPVSIVMDFFELKDIDPDSMAKEDLKKIIDMVKRVFNLFNEPEKVEKIIKSCDIADIVEISKTITVAMSSKIDQKKKTDTPT